MIQITMSGIACPFINAPGHTRLSCLSAAGLIQHPPHSKERHCSASTLTVVVMCCGVSGGLHCVDCVAGMGSSSKYKAVDKTFCVSSEFHN